MRWKKVISLMVAIAMMITVLPGNQAQAANKTAVVENDAVAVNQEAGMNINIHFYDTDEAYDGMVYLQYWDDPTVATISTEGEEFKAWGVTRYPLEDESEEEGEDWYGLNMQGKVVGFQFLSEDGSKNTGTVYNKALENYTGDLYYKDGVWYTSNPVENVDAERLQLVTLQEVFYLVGSIAPTGWSLESTSQLSKNEDGTYSITLKAVNAGSYEFKVLQDPDNFAWQYAWGGTGSGGNFALTLEEMSDVTITIDPQDTTKQIAVTTAKVDEAIANLKSPVYATDGAITFNYIGTTGEAIIVKGSFNDWDNILMQEQATETTGTSIYSATVDNVTAAGIYTYGIAKVDEKGSQKEWIGDPLNAAKYGDNAAIVRNPVVSEIGLTTLYAPDGEGYKVYYKEAVDQAAVAVTSESIQIGDTLTKEDAEELGYKVVEMTKDGQFADGMYSAKIADGIGSYMYTMVDETDRVIGDPYNFEDKGSIGQAFRVFEVTKFDEELIRLKSPVVNKDGSVTFNYLDASLTETAQISVAGSFNGWGDAIGKDVMALENAEKGIWSKTIEGFTPGVYAYKFVIGKDGWITDPMASLSQGGNSAFVVDGLALKEAVQVEKNKSVALPKKANLFTEDSMTAKDVDVTFSLNAVSAEGITLEDGVLSVTDAYTEKTVPLIMTDGENETEVSVEVVEKMYGYTIHYYAPDGIDYDETDLWIWEADGAAYNTGYVFNQETEEDEIGRTWATATYSFPTDAINFIARSKGLWASDGGWQESTRLVEIPEGQDGIEIWVIKGNPYVFTEWAEEFEEPEKRYILIEYDRPEGDYEDWNVYTWNSGADASLNVSNYFKEINGKYVATIEIGELTSSIGFLIRLGEPEDGEDWVKDVEGDRSILAPLDQKVIKVKATQGSSQLEVVPYNKGCELQVNENRMVYYYRDDQLFKEGTLDNLAAVEVEIDGERQYMAYDPQNERYEYEVENPEEKDYEYKFIITDKEGNVVETRDLFNTRTTEDETKSVITYKNITVNVSGEVKADAIDYNQNAVLSVKAEAQNGEELEVTDCYVDLRELGGKEKTPIETALMEVSIGVKDTITAGTKKLPITVVDQYGKRHTGETTINIKARELADGDFDWDEAIIYFLLTDRFHDGNEENNDAYGVGDYDPDGPSSYHGGDFAGLTKKLDYIKELGVNTIWITPIVENILEDQHDDKNDIATYGYHGYWASSFEKLNAHLGTVEEFHTLIDEAHERGIKIMVDIVANHAGYGTEESEEFKGMFRDKDVEGHDVLGPLSGLPDFATEREDVREKLVNWQTKWVSELGVTSKGNTIDYYRVDTVKHVESTTWASLKNELTKVAPEFKMIGEYAGAGHVDDFGYLNSGKMDSLLDFGFNDMALKFVKGSVEAIEKEMESRNSVISNTGTLGSFLGSHDEDGFKYDLIENSGYTESEAQALTNVAAALQITAKGQPVIYYGEEVGLSGANNWPFQDNRYDMVFDNLTKEQSDTLAHYKKLLEVRNQYTKVFAKGTRTQIAASDDKGYVLFAREYNNQKVAVGLNIQDENTAIKVNVKDLIPANAQYDGVKIKDLYTGNKFEVDEDGVVEVEIPAVDKGGTVLLVAELLIDEPTPATPAPATPTPATPATPTPATPAPASSVTVNNTTATMTAGVTSTTLTGTKAVISAAMNQSATVATLNTAKNKVTATISVPSKTVIAQLIRSKTKSVQVKLQIATAVKNHSKISNLKINLPRDVVAMAKTMNKSLQYTIVDETGKTIFTWTLSTSDLAKMKQSKAIDLNVTVLTTSKVSAAKSTLNKDKNNNTGVVLRVAQSGTLPTTAKVNVYVGQQQGLKNNKKVYVYYLNSKTKKLEQLPAATSKMKNGYVTITVVKGGDYVLLAKKANSKAVTALSKQVTVTANKSVKKNKSTNMKVTLPDTIMKLTSLSSSNRKKYLPSGILGAKISYKSSNKKIATVNKNGKVTGKKQGKVRITTTIKLSNGSKVTVNRTITVK